LKSADGEVALARNNRHFYLAGRPNKRLLDDLLCRLIVHVGISPLDLPEDIRIRDNGAIRFVFNYGREAVDISKIIGNASLLLGERLLPPCGVAVFRRTMPESAGAPRTAP
jgi:beta-galactosidase